LHGFGEAMIVLVIGRRGLGKTTLAEWRAQRFNMNAAAFDPRGQFRSYAVQTSDLKEVEKEFSRDWTREEPLSLAYRPPRVIQEDGSIDERELENHWNKFAHLLWQFTGEDDGCASYCLIVDEAHNLQSPQSVNGWLSTFVREVPTRERHDKNPVDIIMTSHRLQDFHGSVTSQVGEIYIFNMIKPRDLKVVQDEWGEDLAERVRSLRTPRSTPPGRDVLFIDPETGESRLMDNPAEWFVNIRKPRVDAMSKVVKLHEKYGDGI
jgi:hypothetical protein